VAPVDAQRAAGGEQVARRQAAHLRGEPDGPQAAAGLAAATPKHQLPVVLRPRPRRLLLLLLLLLLLFVCCCQSEYGDIYKATLAYEGETVTELKVKYFDTLPPAVSLAVLKTGFLFAASETGNHALYQFVVGVAGRGASRQWYSDTPTAQHASCIVRASRLCNQRVCCYLLICTLKGAVMLFKRPVLPRHACSHQQ